MTNKPNTAVAYYRVSTGKQQKSGLGLAGQKVAVIEYTSRTGMEVLAEYTEAESGKDCARPQFQKAVAHAKRAGSLLVVAKLDRLARSVKLTAELMESDVEFVCCDNPHANRLTIHILAAVAEHERKIISERTREALREYRARGGKLGAELPQCRNLTEESMRKGREMARQANKRRTQEAYADLRPMLEALWPCCTGSEIAKILNEQGHRTRTGRTWTHTKISQICAKLGIPKKRKTS